MLCDDWVEAGGYVTACGSVCFDRVQVRVQAGGKVVFWCAAEPVSKTTDCFLGAGHANSEIQEQYWLYTLFQSLLHNHELMRMHNIMYVVK